MTLTITDRWTTHDGEWQTSSKPYSITKAQLDKYGTLNIPGRGGAAHLFVKAQPGDIVTYFTTDGNKDNVKDVVADKYGWTNFPLWKTSAFWDGAGGPWGVKVNGAEVVRGLGLPEGYHVSTFLVAQDIAGSVPDVGIVIPLPPTPPIAGDIYQVVIRTMRDGIQIGEQIVWQS